MALVRLRNKKTKEVEYKSAGYAKAFPKDWELADSTTTKTEAETPENKAPLVGKKEAK